MAEFRIKDIDYRSRKMSATTQFAVLRKLGPIFANYQTLRGLLDEVFRRAEAKETEQAGADVPTAAAAINSPEAKAALNDALLHAVAGAVSEIAKLPDEDFNFVIDQVMLLVTRKSGAGFAPVWAGGTKTFMFDDIDLVAMVAILKEVIVAEFIPFLASGALSMFAGLLR